jgi:alkyl sulfatase BDS1-like metallo-beta-lactamase superfamily hydrolase
MSPTRLLCLAGAALALACSDAPPPPAPPVSSPEDLAAHSAEFERGVVEVTDGVHVAIGFGLANSILIEGDDGVIVVDTMESIEAGREVREAFREITPDPVRAIVFTHNHTDHVFGSPAFADPGEPPPAVFAHETTEYYIDRIVNVIRPAIYQRSMRMFGNYLPEEYVLNAGIGPFLATGHGGGTLGLLRPTDTFSDRLEVEVAGVRMVLVHAPGETNDQLFVWLPDKRVLLPGDNFYRSFPNLYTIRGINRGLTPDELAAAIALPPHLATSPFLQPFYGTVEWSVRAIFDGYLGWFDGRAAHLSPLAPTEKAERMAALAQEGRSLPEAAKAALAAGDLRWAAELADSWTVLEPESEEARLALAGALRGLGGRHPSANGRHYYLTQALEAEGAVEVAQPDPTTFPQELVYSFPISGILRSMSVQLDPHESADVDTVVGFRFPDVDEAYTMHVRRGVAEVQPVFPADPDLTVTVDSRVWKDLLTGRRNAALTLASSEVAVEGSTLDLVAFLRLFAPD